MIFVFYKTEEDRRKEIGSLEVADNLARQYVDLFDKYRFMLDDEWLSASEVGFNPTKNQFEVEL